MHQMLKPKLKYPHLESPGMIPGDIHDEGEFRFSIQTVGEPFKSRLNLMIIIAMVNRCLRPISFIVLWPRTMPRQLILFMNGKNEKEI